jgi:hypothetical protein
MGADFVGPGGIGLVLGGVEILIPGSKQGYHPRHNHDEIGLEAYTYAGGER